MAYKLKTNKSKRCNYGSKRATGNIKWLVFHYTANDGDTDEANANYFRNNNVGASAHAFVDDDSVTVSVPASYIAWAVGSNGLLDAGSPYHNKGGKYFGRCTNANSYSIEMCDTKRDGKHNLSTKTRKNAIKYGAKIMKKYNIDINHVVRHFDVNAKLCPIFWVTNDADWKKFKKELQAECGKTTSSTSSSSSSAKGTYSGTMPTLPSKGYFVLNDFGTQVKCLQNFLNWCINSDLDVDGIYGSKTKDAVKEFQKKYGLAVDGKFGKKSLAKTIKK